MKKLSAISYQLSASRGQARWHYCDGAKRAGNSKYRSCSTGQVMLLTTLILSGTILAAVTIAGLLLVYQIRQAGNAAQSARALYAADAGFEKEAYKLFQAIEFETPTDVCDTGLSAFTTEPTPTISSRTIIAGDDVLINSSAISGSATRAVGFKFYDFAPRAVCVPPVATP